MHVSKVKSGNGYIILTRKPKQGVRLRSHADTQQCILGLIVDLRFPIVDLVLLGDWQVTHNSALGVKELNLCPSFYKAVGNL